MDGGGKRQSSVPETNEDILRVRSCTSPSEDTGTVK